MNNLLKDGKVKAIMFLVVAVILFSGCAATTPVRKVWQPWSRVIGSNQTISLQSKLSITVVGETEPLNGQEELLQTDIKQKLISQLIRRGYEISNVADYYFVLTYKTLNPVYVTEDFSYYSGTYSSSSKSYGLGVLTALSVGMTSSTISTNTHSSFSNTISNYTHVISLEIYNDSGKQNIIWKADALWDSRNPNLQNQLSYTLQLLLSGLPYESEIIPNVLKVQEDKAWNYFVVNCNNVRFVCPVIPYRILYPYVYNNVIPSKVKNHYALVAFNDLITTAERALPIGSKNFSNPFSNTLWSKVMLGKKYKLGSDDNPVNVMVKLYGNSWGYEISKCWIATDEEFNEFVTKLDVWEKALIDYYDFYE